MAMLSMEYEDEAQCPSSCCSSGSASDASTSPTAASDRASSAFKLSMAGSEASRLEESLFQLDEEGGARTPPRARSPDAPTVRLPPSRFAAEAAGKGGAAAAGQQAQPLGAPVTPATAAKGLSVSFVSPLSAGDADSLPASFDSLGLHDSPNGGTAMSLAAPSSLAASSGFAGPASFAPSASSRSAQEGGMSAGGGMRGTSRRSARKHRSRRKLAIGSRLLKLTTQVRACAGLCSWGWGVLLLLLLLLPGHASKRLSLPAHAAAAAPPPPPPAELSSPGGVSRRQRGLPLHVRPGRVPRPVGGAVAGLHGQRARAAGAQAARRRLEERRRRAGPAHDVVPPLLSWGSGSWAPALQPQSKAHQHHHRALASAPVPPSQPPPPLRPYPPHSSHPVAVP